MTKNEQINRQVRQRQCSHVVGRDRRQRTMFVRIIQLQHALEAPRCGGELAKKMQVKAHGAAADQLAGDIASALRKAEEVLGCPLRQCIFGAAKMMSDLTAQHRD